MLLEDVVIPVSNPVAVTFEGAQIEDPLTLFVSRVGTGSPVIRLASAVRIASSSHPGFSCRMSAKDGKAGREGVCIAHPHAVAVGNMDEHRGRVPVVSELLRKYGTKCGSAGRD